MDKELSLPAEADSYEFINQNDARSIRSDSSDVSSTDSGIPLSDAEKALADRVRHLKQENKEIRLAIDNYQEALQLCQEKLNSVIAQQGEILFGTQESYKRAKTKVERQNQKISDLEKQLQEEKNKHSPNVEDIQANKQQNEKKDSEKLDVLEKSNFKESVYNLQKLVGNLSGLTPDELHTSISTELLQDLIHLNEDIEESIKPLLKSNHPTPVKNAIEEELKLVKEQLELVKEQLKSEEETRAQLESKITKLGGHLNKNQMERVEMQDVQEEMKLLEKDMDKMDRLRAGFISRDSQTTEDSFSLGQKGQELGIRDSFDISEYEAKIAELKEQMVKQKRTFDKRETAFLRKEETILKEKKDLEKELSEIKIKLAEKVDGSQLEEIEEAKSKLQQRLQEQEDMCEAIQKELDESLATNDDLEIKLKETDIAFRQELKKKEDTENDLKARVYSFYQDVQAKDMEINDLKARRGLECQKMSSALDEMRKELTAVYSENELLTEREAASKTEFTDLQSRNDNLTAQLVSAEEMVELKETDIRAMQAREKSLASELETLPWLKQQLDVYQTDFNTERQTKQKVEDDNKKLRNEVGKLRAEIERFKEEANDPTGSRLLEMQRRHGCGNSMQAGNESPWSGFYDQYLAPRGPPAARNSPHQPPPDHDVNRQVSGGRCPKCERAFPDLDTLQTHVVECLESESSESVGRKICPKCQGSFPDLDTLQIHVMECLDDI